MTKKWQARVQEHYNECVKQIGDEEYIFGVFLFGSQNYGLATSSSDVDTKAIVLPNLTKLALNEKPISKEIHFDNGEHLTITDIRLYIAQLRKGNPSALELMFTEYYIINPRYAEVWNKIILAREEISHVKVHNTVNALKGLMANELKYLSKETESTKSYFDNFGYNTKRLMNLMRLCMTLNAYSRGKTMQACLRMDKYREYLLAVKQGFYLKKQAEYIVDNIIFQKNTSAERYNQYTDILLTAGKQKEIELLLTKCAEEAFKIALRSDVV